MLRFPGVTRGMAKIIVTGNDQRREFELGAFNTIGRHPDNTIQILDRIISKEHAQIVRQPDGRFLLRDLGSLNGTFLRGERVSEHVLQRRRRDHAGLDLPDLFRSESTQDSVLQQVTIAPGADREPLSARRSRRRRRRASSCPSARSPTSRCCAATTRSCASATSSARAIGLELDLELLLERSSRRRSSWSPPTAA